MTKILLEDYVHFTARSLIGKAVAQYRDAESFDHRERLAALHTLAGLTGPLETLCHRFGLRPLTEIFDEN